MQDNNSKKFASMVSDQANDLSLLFDDLSSYLIIYFE